MEHAKGPVGGSGGEEGDRTWDNMFELTSAETPRG